MPVVNLPLEVQLSERINGTLAPKWSPLTTVPTTFV